ncbi:MAG TPA: DUF3082 domain-containing protein [Leptolyngbyaceae cyanobacterium M33_DOE_097]|uniref:DUF3082 domain-containing protein n=1 Tax=Oscillatoriales cyanobacterium SpSt-418 TaxID=2282169 RepID=A0A7C3KE95_9CYAN|nr:DUF3082 domain-containing protein [Leptolyngbyaceae cyanobacterium M33_DOE_097]
MADSSQTEATTPSTSLSTPKSSSVNPTPIRCLGGSAISAGLTFLMYLLTKAVASTFAATPIQTDSFVVYRISTAVRTLVIGMTALGVWVFGIATLGLFGLAIQLIIQRPQNSSTSSENPQ